MNENFLHFVWKYQKFDSSELETTTHQKLVVFNPGNHNHDSGPDFEEARIKIGEIEWAGNVEIHLRSSDWDKHKHSENPAYKNVILHVVWENDLEIMIDKTPIPTLELKQLIDPKLISSYTKHVNVSEPIACANQFSSELEMAYVSMLDKVMVERLERKAEDVLSILKETKNDWDETCYRVLAQNFGFSLNKSAFQKLGEILSFSVLKKNLSESKKSEALLFGQAGFLNNSVDTYQNELAQEFRFLSKKHELPAPLNQHEWKFGKMRPANFPSLRIAQFASLFVSQPRLFTSLIDSSDSKETIELLEFELSDYWNNHYDFGKKRKGVKNALGKGTQENILINTVAPLLAAYAKHSSNQNYMESALEILEKLPAEGNRITKEWNKIGKKPKTAFESQAQIQLFNEYCQKRRCLSCSIGVTLLNK